MKLSKYAEAIGIKYQTAYEHFVKGKIPGAYKLETGTIIVPDELVDRSMLLNAMSEDLDKSDAAGGADGAPQTKPRTQKDMLKDKLINIKDIITADTDNFDASQYVARDGQLPKPTRSIKDYDSERKALTEAAESIVDTLIHNYITEDQLLKIGKSIEMRKVHVDKLIGIDTLIKSSEDMITRLREGIDGNEAIPNIFATFATFQNQLMTFMNNRSKHLTEVENYWYDIADKHGLITDEELKMEEIASKAEEAAAEVAAETGASPEGRIVSQVQLNDNIEKIIAQLKAEEEEKALNNPKQTHNPYNN